MHAILKISWDILEKSSKLSNTCEEYISVGECNNYL